jgi:hypothetical protein
MRWSQIMEREFPSPQWVVPKSCRLQIEDGSSVVVTVDSNKVDADWSRDKDFYIGGPDSKNVIRNRLGSRYDQFGEWFAKGQPVEMSELYISYYDKPGFVNGRHRFAWMRDHGVVEIPVVVPTEQAEEIKRRYG